MFPQDFFYFYSFQLIPCLYKLPLYSVRASLFTEGHEWLLSYQIPIPVCVEAKDFKELLKS